MHYIVAFLRFWYDFLVGDDWKIAVGVVVALVLAALAAHLIASIAGAIVLIAGILLAEGFALRRSVQGKG
ncbi:MAG: hypothetical protein ACYDCQ_15810 [Dehalococcoidia bacterium]